jgi:HlyD family secretion protein
MTKPRSSWLAWLATLLLAGGGVFLYLRFGSAKNAEPPKFDTAHVDRGPLIAKITATGTLSALVTVQVGSQVSGRLQEIYADFNAVVKKGQVIAKIDPQLFIAARAQARANAAAAQANAMRSEALAVEAERQYKRLQSLGDQKLIAQADAETAQANWLSAKAQVAASKAEIAQAAATLHQAEVNLAYTTIVSPINGVVISRSVDVGQTVAASLQAPILFVIAEDLRKMQVDASVSEADVGKLSPGMPASFTVDAFPGERFRGSIRQIRNAAQTLQNVVTYNSVIDVANPEQKLRPGMTASVVFVYANRDDVLRVPNSALRFRPTPEVLAQLRDAGVDARRPGPLNKERLRPTADAEEDPGRRTVWALRKGKPEPLTIRIGVSDGSVTEVLEGGLQPGDTLITDVASATGPGGARPPGGARSGFRMF